MDSLDVVPISRVQATQRAGRAGRTRPGKCFRLYTRLYFESQMPDAALPEIQRCGLAGAVLHLKALRLPLDVLGFDFLDPPSRGALEEALRRLYITDAIDADGDITPLGRQMANMPLEPDLARALLAAHKLRGPPAQRRPGRPAARPTAPRPGPAGARRHRAHARPRRR
ncbi:hypothetical protein MNEG_16653, partial [Monoraphidium neglectum]